MTLEFEYQFQDLLESNRVYIWLWRAAYFTLGLFILLVAPGLIIDYSETGNSHLKEILSTYLPFTAFMLLWPLLLRFQIWNGWRSYRAIQGTITYEIHDDGVSVKTKGSDSFVKWETFTKSTETRNLFLLHISRQIRYVIPKRAFINPAQAEEFRDIVRRKIVS